MPRRDGTGPIGSGAMTGRGLGLCAQENTTNNDFRSRSGLGVRSGLGRGCRCGSGRGLGRSLGRGFGVNQNFVETQKDSLQAQKELLKNRLKVIENELNNL